MPIELHPIESSLISHVGYDPQAHLLHIRFATKNFSVGSLYEYANVNPAIYEAACTHISTRTGELSFGQYFQQEIKPNDKRYPFRKLEDAHDAPAVPIREALTASLAETTDFASGQPLPASLAEEPEPLPDDEAKLIAEAEALAAKTKEIGEIRGNAIVIASAEAADLAMTTGKAIARMRDALEKTLRPKITELYAPYKAALAILSRYDKPLEEDQNRLRAGLSAYNQEQQRKAREEEQRLRREQEIQAEKDATARAQELQLHDAVAAEARGETALAEQIIAAPALPLAPVFAAPVRVLADVPRQKGVSIKKKMAWEMLDESKLPDEYWIVDTKAIDKLVDGLGERANTALNGAIRAYDAGTVAFSKKG